MQNKKNCTIEYRDQITNNIDDNGGVLKDKKD